MPNDNQDIREWARGQGMDIGSKGRISAGIRQQYETARNGQHAVPDKADEVDGDAPDLMPPARAEEPASAPSDGLPLEGSVVPERKPEPVRRKRRSLLSREPREPGRPKPKAPRKRVSIENLISSGWGIAAMALARSPRAIPVARILNMQAPVAGVIIDDAAKGTIVDKLLQPFARAGEKAEVAFALAGPPLLVGAMTANPQLFPVLKPMLKMSMMSWLQVSTPAAKKAQAKVEAFAEEFGEVDLDGMIDALWADVPVPTQPSQAEEDAIRRARGE